MLSALAEVIKNATSVKAKISYSIKQVPIFALSNALLSSSTNTQLNSVWLVILPAKSAQPKLTSTALSAAWVTMPTEMSAL